MKFGRRITSLVLIVLLVSAWFAANQSIASASRTGSSTLRSAELASADHVVIISIDGAGRRDILSRASIPNIERMAAAGAVTWHAQTTLPSTTLPSHTSMLTGVDPQVHGVRFNWYKPRFTLKRPTALAVAHDAGLKTAMVVAKEKLKLLAPTGTVDFLRYVPDNALGVADAAARLIISERPNLLFIHFRDPDGAGHASGWGSPAQLQSLSLADRGVGKVVAALETAAIAANSTVIVTADHGGHDRTHGTDDPLDVNIPWIAWGAGIKPHTVISNDVYTYDTAATALYLLGVGVPVDWVGRPVDEALIEEVSS